MDLSPTRARLLCRSALAILWGIILSGPIAVTLVLVLAPQPEWRDVPLFVSHYAWLQTLPYWFGFLISGGFVFFTSALFGAARQDRRPRELAGLAFTAVAAAMIFVNYVLQTAFVPQWVETADPALAWATMANPRSLGWALEMYGYGVLGVATGCIAPLFDGPGRQRVIHWLLTTNCAVSVATALLVPAFPGWLLTLPGQLAGGAWNVLLIVLMALVLREYRPGRTAGGAAQRA